MNLNAQTKQRIISSFASTGTFYLPLGIYSSTLKEYRTEQEIYTKEQAEAVATENFNIYLSHLAEKNIQF